MNSRLVLGWTKIEKHLWKTPKGYFVDLELGFRGQKFRVSFLKRADAEAFILKKKIEYQQQKHLGRSSLKGGIDTSEFLEKYYSLVASRQADAAISEKYRISAFKEFFKGVALNKFTREDWDRFVQSRLEEGRAVATINRMKNSLRPAFKWAVESGYLSYNVMEAVKRIKGDAKRCRWLTEDEAQRLIQAAHDLKDEDLVEVIQVCLYTGFRKSNLERLEWSHINENFVTAMKTKNYKPYDVPHLDDKVKDLYRRLLQKRPFGLVLNTVNLGRRFRDAARHAGLYPSQEAFAADPELAKDPNLVTPHVLRHTFASWLLQKGVPIYTVSKWMGHSSVKVTEDTYGHLSKEHHLTEAQKVSMPTLIDNLSTVEKGTVIPISAILDGKSIAPKGIRTPDLCLERVTDEEK